VPLPLTGMSYAISLNGHEFATGVSNKTQIIPALGEQRLDVTITSSVMSLVQQIRSLTQSQDKTFSYKLDGKFHVTDKFTPLAFSTQDKIKLDNF
jgi:LEA14-like dessication related protein